MKIVLFNGPPRSGKDTCSLMLADILAFEMNKDNHNLSYVPMVFKFAQPLRDVLNAVFCVKEDFFRVLEEQELKDTPMDEFFGNSFRQMMIHVSENYLKPLLGSDCMGKLAVRRIQTETQEYLETDNPSFSGEFICIFSDLGFPDELGELVQKYGEENITVVQLSKDGTDFSKDSRDYVVHSNLIFLQNNGSLEELKEKMSAVAELVVMK